MENYVSLIMDVEKSRMYPIDQRNSIQKYMNRYIDCLNDFFCNDIKYRVTFSAGDELQGLFFDVTAAVLFFRMFEMLMRPVKIRAGIGVGEWTVKVEEGLSTQQDGPVYHRARQAIEEASKMQLQNVRICSEKDDILVNHLINASNVLKTQQIYMQNMVLVILELLYPFVAAGTEKSGEEIAKELLDIKLEYMIAMRKYNKAGGYRQESFHMGEVTAVSPVAIDGKIIEPESVIVKKNTAFMISRILGSTRQNADSIMRRGNANKIRELDFIALQYVEKTYGGDIWK